MKKWWKKTSLLSSAWFLLTTAVCETQRVVKEKNHNEFVLKCRKVLFILSNYSNIHTFNTLCFYVFDQNNLFRFWLVQINEQNGKSQATTEKIKVNKITI